MRKRTTRRTTAPKKYKVVVEQTTEKAGLTWSQAMNVKKNVSKKIGRRKGTKIKMVKY